MPLQLAQSRFLATPPPLSLSLLLLPRLLPGLHFGLHLICAEYFALNLSFYNFSLATATGEWQQWRKRRRWREEEV